MKNVKTSYGRQTTVGGFVIANYLAVGKAQSVFADTPGSARFEHLALVFPAIAFAQAEF